MSFASPEKEKYFLFIYEVITWEKILKRASNYYSPRSVTAVLPVARSDAHAFEPDWVIEFQAIGLHVDVSSWESQHSSCFFLCFPQLGASQFSVRVVRGAVQESPRHASRHAQ